MATPEPTPKPSPFLGEGVIPAYRAVPSSFSIARALLIAMLLLAPLDFGAVRPWAWAMLAVSAVILLLLWVIGSVRQAAIRIHWSPLYIPAALFLVLGLVQYAAHLSLDPYATWESLIKLVTDLIFFFLAGQLWADASERTWGRFGFAITAYAFLMALFAIIQYFSSHGLIYWVVKAQGSAFGPYVNRNDYAGLLEMLIPIAAAYVLSRPQDNAHRLLAGFAVLVPACSVPLSGSRGGLTALLGEGLIFMVGLYRQSTARRRRILVVVGSLGIGAATVLLFFWIAPAHISRRLETVAGVTHSPEVTLGERLVAWKDSLGILYDHPLIGTGLGSFAVAFPQHQSFASDVVWDHAHDDYVEALIETGALGGLLMLLALFLFWRLAFWNLPGRLKNPRGWIQLGATLGVCGLLIHSFVDFNLHIPANAAWFVVLVALSTNGARNRSAEVAAPGRPGSG